MQRLAGAREPDKFERESQVFFEKIRQTYLLRAAQHPQRFRVINANQPIEIVKNLVEEIVSTL
jgi:dTMP kinase